MSVHCAVLETPEEAHQVGQEVVAKLIDEQECYSTHYNDQHQVDHDSESAAEFVDEETDEEASHNFTHAKEHHGQHCVLELLCVVSPHCLREHVYKEP